MKMETTKDEREQWVNRIFVQLLMNNYGLPPSVEYKDMDFEKAIKLKAIQELYIRMNLYITTNEKSSGSIKFPEARRRIEYFFSPKSIKYNHVDLKALSKKKYFINTKK